MKKRLVIFGATGDLTSRFLFPALIELYGAGHLPEGFSILGIAIDRWDSGKFRDHIAERLGSAHAGDAAAKAVLEMLEYRGADVADKADVKAILEGMEEPAVFYLALPPGLFAPVIEALAAVGISDDSAIAIEKPFGEDLTSARALNCLLRKHFPERMIYRMDSFLGEQTVHNILGMRFANRIFEPLWNSQHIAKVEIIWDETLTLEGRVSYYDRAGALKDMIQNHLLQLLGIIAMEPPPTLSEHDLRDRKVDVIRSVRTLSQEEIASGTIRGRYGEGRIGRSAVPAYVDEKGIDPSRNTETFAAVRLWIDNWRWAGVPFILRTGKALPADRMEINIFFRPVPHKVFPRKQLPNPNVLQLGLNPDTISIGVNITAPGEGFDLEYVNLERELADQKISAYGVLLLHVMEGKQTLFIRDDEAEELWRIVEPIVEGWGNDVVPLVEYPAGSEVSSKFE